IHSRSGRYHHADILNVLSDFHIAKLHGTNGLRTKINHQLVSRNVIYADSELIGEMLSAEGCDSTLTDFIFVADGKPTAESFWDVCREIVSRLAAAGLNESNHKEREALGCMIEIANYLTELQQSRHYIENLETLQKIYSRIAQRRSVSFFGQPLSGLQILGMLETRNLDFKRVILLSTNEGILPAGRSANTLIPYDLKTTFNLPTYHEKDAVFAYHFYRLLQRAEEIWLVCSTETDSSGKGEPSRFILQVANELAPRFAENIELGEQIVEVENLTPILTPRKPAEKSDFVMRRLNEMNERGFSPSALNNYRACPMKFYYENILRIRENKDVVEDMDQSDLGTCIHETLQQIFTATDGGLLSASTLRQHIENLDITLQSKFDSLFAVGRALEGRNHLLYSVAKSQILNLLKLEIAELEKGRRIEIVGLEKELSHNIQVGNKSVKLSGIADRIDRRGGVVCICDYKTGRVDEKELAMDDNKMAAGTVPDKWFQVMFYALMYSRMTGGAEPMLSGIYPLRHLGRYLIAATWDGEAIIENELLDRVENMIRDLMAEIFDPTIPFTPAEDCKACRFCPAKATCPSAKE
ncbi:MAG: PD-(D/E)XK nuclease family protein, partial [Bacteroidales bacterium]|nr:PD-(D/E)XK nuclease family protein [Bacteroidales bacterium]